MLQEEHFAILLIFIKLPFVIKIFDFVFFGVAVLHRFKLPFDITIFVLSILDWPFYTGLSYLLTLRSLFCLHRFKLPFVINIFVLSILEWPIYTGLSYHLTL